MSFILKAILLGLALCLSAFTLSVGQSGYIKSMDFGNTRTYAGNLALKGLDQILVCGVYLQDNAQGLFLSFVDTSGILLRTDYFKDTILGRSIDYSFFNEIGIINDSTFLLQLAYLESGTEGLLQFSDDGIKLLPEEYVQDERTEIYRRIWFEGGRYFVLGHAQRLNYRADILF